MSSKFKINTKTNAVKGTRISADIAGNKVSLSLHYGGLGMKFFDKLGIEPNKICQVDTINNITESKGSVRSRGIQLAIEMKQCGINVNDIILISSKTHAHQTIVILATLFLGAIVAPVDPDSPQSECLEIVRKLKPKMCFCDTRTISQIERILATLNLRSEIVDFGTKTSDLNKFIKLYPVKTDPDFRPVYIDYPNQNVAFILPTQGTTGHPKLVCLSHQNILMHIVNFLEIFDNPTKILSFFPLSWILQTILACACLDNDLIRIIPGTFNERNACKIIQDFGVDLAMLGTDFTLRLIENFAIRDYNLKCLKGVLVGIVTTNSGDLQHMRHKLPNVKFLQVYLATETGFISAVSVANYNDSISKTKCVGKLLNNSKAKVLDIDTKESVGPNQYGELYFSGDGLMLGYLKDNAATLAVMDRSYYKTGDVVKFDTDGWLYLRGRVYDIFLEASERFYPMEIEDVILSHPYVQDVAVIGNESELVACIQRKADSNLNADKILQFMAERVPKYRTFTKILFYDALPRTSIGTIKKRDLVDEILRVKIEYSRSLASISGTPSDN